MPFKHAKSIRYTAALLTAAALLVLTAPAAFALDCSGAASSGRLDMSTWENVLRSLYLFAGACFFTAVIAALKTGKPGGIKSAFAVLLAVTFGLIYNSVQANTIALSAATAFTASGI